MGRSGPPSHACLGRRLQHGETAFVARIQDAGSLCRTSHRNLAEGRINSRGSNRCWMKVQWQVRGPSILSRTRPALIKFARHYNETWLVARHGYRTPVQVRADQCRLDQNAMADLKFAA